jgi:hypothetical protein
MSMTGLMALVAAVPAVIRKKKDGVAARQMKVIAKLKERVAKLKNERDELKATLKDEHRRSARLASDLAGERERRIAGESAHGGLVQLLAHADFQIRELRNAMPMPQWPPQIWPYPGDPPAMLAAQGIPYQAPSAEILELQQARPRGEDLVRSFCTCVPGRHATFVDPLLRQAREAEQRVMAHYGSFRVPPDGAVAVSIPGEPQLRQESEAEWRDRMVGQINARENG